MIVGSESSHCIIEKGMRKGAFLFVAQANGGFGNIINWAACFMAALLAQGTPSMSG